MINLVLTPLHYIYLIFIIIIILAMVKKKDISLLCILGIFIWDWPEQNQFINL